MELTVKMMAGVSFGVILEEVGEEIEDIEGEASDWQELFMLVEGAEDGSEEPSITHASITDVKRGYYSSPKHPSKSDCDLLLVLHHHG